MKFMKMFYFSNTKQIIKTIVIFAAAGNRFFLCKVANKAFLLLCL